MGPRILPFSISQHGRTHKSEDIGQSTQKDFFSLAGQKRDTLKDALFQTHRAEINHALEQSSKLFIEIMNIQHSTR